MVNATRDAIICADGAGKITYLNPAAERLFDYPSGALIGVDLTALMPARFRRAHRAGLKRFVATGQSSTVGRTLELTGLDSHGVEFPIELSLSQYKRGKEFEVIGVIRDITVRNSLLEQLEERATTDYLTGLWNRHAFDKKLAAEQRRAERYKKPLSLLMADLDYFKQYNDLYGHQAGDAALKSIAGVFRREVRSADLVARYGGEEIAVVLPETGLDQAVQLAERVLIAVRQLDIEGAALPGGGPLTISIGVAAVAGGDRTGIDLLKKADSALYRAKNSGRNRLSANIDPGGAKPPLEKSAEDLIGEA